MTYEDIKDSIMRITICVLALAGFLCLILGVKHFYDYLNTPKYTKVICSMNGESLEIKINKIKKLENGEYLITDDEDAKWQLSSRVCTFVER